jgi:hypothetical protein
MRLLVDSDIFCKLGASDLLVETLAIFDATISECGRLAALPYMLRRGKLHKQYGEVCCEKLRAVVDEMPIVPEASPAWLDKLAKIPNIDPGEAQLLASAAEHSLILLTGDKRALGAVRAVPDLVALLAGRVVSLESSLLALCMRKGDATIHEALAPLQKLDKTIQMCFASRASDPRVGLRSYFEHLQREVDPLRLWAPPTENG